MTRTRTRAGRFRHFLGPGTCTAIVVAGCGGSAEYANEPRPPAPINISAAITEKRVKVSPRRFGAGPIVLIVANQSARAQEVTIETDEVAGGEPGIRQTSSPINPDGTAELKVRVREGSYKVSVDSKSIAPASVRVGEQRESAQNELLQP
jgi:hypothetical protein